MFGDQPLKILDNFRHFQAFGESSAPSSDTTQIKSRVGLQKPFNVGEVSVTPSNRLHDN